MTNTFVVYQVSSRETIRYEIPTTLEWVFDEYRDFWPYTLTLGGRRRTPTIQRVLDQIRPFFAELVDQIKVTKTPTALWPKGYSGTITTYDYPDP